MNRFVITLIVFVFFLPVVGRTGVFPNGDEYEPSEDASYIPQVVELESPQHLESLKEDGVVVIRHRGDIALCLVPYYTGDYMLSHTSKMVKSKRGRERSRKNIPAMDFARNYRDAYKVLNGNGITCGHRGKGVVVGLCDIGFDSSHPAFRTATGDATRIKRITQYVEEEGLRIQLDDETQWRDWTDNPNQYHATHVANILAGARDVEGYQGIASEADIVVSTSQLSDVGLLAGAEDILEYAKSVGKPCVINMSMGNYVGPHDGTSLFNRYLDMMADDGAIFVLSAGNEGTHNNGMSVTLSDGMEDVRCRLANYKWNNFDMCGYTDVWLGDDDNLTIQAVIYDEYSRKIVYEMPVQNVCDGMKWGVSTETPEEYEALDTELEKFYSGWINMQASYWNPNGKLNILVTYDMHTDTFSPAGQWARYNIGLIVRGNKGTVVDFFADGQTTFLKSFHGSPYAPGTDWSISDLACAKSVVSVGMSTSRADVPRVDGSMQSHNEPVGQVSRFSSYGTLHDGRVMPMTVAPGYWIVSAMSRHWVGEDSQRHGELAVEAVAEDGSPVYYWTEGGTSMSAPYVAGFIATWLEVNPTMTWRDVQRTIQQSNSIVYPDKENPRNGEGWFDPVRGMELVIRDVPVHVLDTKNVSPLEFVSTPEKCIVIGSGMLHVQLHTADGRLVGVFSGMDRVEVGLSGIAKGIYIIKGGSDRGSSSISVIK